MPNRVEWSLLTERRKLKPYGLAGGGAGSCGSNYVTRGGRRTKLPAKANIDLESRRSGTR